MCSAFVWPHGWEIFSLSLANWLQMDSCQDELSPSDPIETVCQHLQPPVSCKSLTSGITDHAPCAHFRFRSRSDSIRLRVKTVGFRSGVLDMCVRTGGGCLWMTFFGRRIWCWSSCHCLFSRTPLWHESRGHRRTLCRWSKRDMPRLPESRCGSFRARAGCWSACISA